MQSAAKISQRLERRHHVVPHYILLLFSLVRYSLHTADQSTRKAVGSPRTRRPPWTGSLLRRSSICLFVSRDGYDNVQLTQSSTPIGVSSRLLSLHGKLASSGGSARCVGAGSSKQRHHAGSNHYSRAGRCRSCLGCSVSLSFGVRKQESKEGRLPEAISL